MTAAAQIPCIDCGRIRELKGKGPHAERCVPCSQEYAANEHRAHHPGPWIVDGLCGQIGGDLWFVSKGGNPGPSKRMCGRCPVTQTCLAWAIDTDQLYGVWGGMTRSERLREGKRREAVA